MKSSAFVVKAAMASLVSLSLILAPLNLEAKKNTNSGNSGNSGGEGTTPTGSAGTGNLVLGAPGVGHDFEVVNITPFSQISEIGRYYKFEFTGIEVQCDADGVTGSYQYGGYMWDTKQKSNNGHGNNCDGVDSSNSGQGNGGPNGEDDPSGDFDDECGHMGDDDNDGVPNHSDPDYNGAHYVYGWWAMWARVNGQFLGHLTFTSPELHAQSPIEQMLFDEPIVFWAQDITLEWHGDGNSNDPDGHFYILGSAVKEPPVPRGSIEITQTYYPDGATPLYSWDINRE